MPLAPDLASSIRKKLDLHKGVNTMVISHYSNSRQNLFAFSVVTTCILLMPVASRTRSFAGGKAKQTSSLQSIRETVAQNEKLYSLVKLNYTRKDSASIPDSELPDPRRMFSNKNVGPRLKYVECTWAQDGIKQHMRNEHYSNAGEQLTGHLSVTDGEVSKMAMLPDLMTGNIVRHADFSWVMCDLRVLGLRPFDARRKLSELLVEEHASFDGEIAVVDGRQAYVVIIEHAEGFAKWWIDCERGMLVKSENYDRHPDLSGARLIYEVKSIELHQLPNGGWFPVRGTWIINRDKSPKPHLKFIDLTVDVNSITIKREDIPGSLFTFEFPEQAKVHNSIIGVTTKGGRVADMHLEAIVDDSIEKLNDPNTESESESSGEEPPKESPTDEPAGSAEDSVDAEESTDTLAALAPTGRRRSYVLWILLPAFFAALALTGLIFVLRRPSRN